MLNNMPSDEISKKKTLPAIPNKTLQSHTAATTTTHNKLQTLLKKL